MAVRLGGMLGGTSAFEVTVSLPSSPLPISTLSCGALGAKTGAESAHDDCSVAPSAALPSTTMARFERRGLVSLIRS